MIVDEVNSAQGQVSEVGDGRRGGGRVEIEGTAPCVGPRIAVAERQVRDVQDRCRRGHDAEGRPPGDRDGFLGREAGDGAVDTQELGDRRQWAGEIDRPNEAGAEVDRRSPRLGVGVDDGLTQGTGAAVGKAADDDLRVGAPDERKDEDGEP